MNWTWNEQFPSIPWPTTIIDCVISFFYLTCMSRGRHHERRLWQTFKRCVLDTSIHMCNWLCLVLERKALWLWMTHAQFTWNQANCWDLLCRLQEEWYVYVYIEALSTASQCTLHVYMITILKWMLKIVLNTFSLSIIKYKIWSSSAHIRHYA